MPTFPLFCTLTKIVPLGCKIFNAYSVAFVLDPTTVNFVAAGGVEVPILTSFEASTPIAPPPTPAEELGP